MVELERQKVIRMRFERMTHSLEGCCSIQLSYRTIFCTECKSKIYYPKLEPKTGTFPMNVQINESWKEVLQHEFEQPYFETITQIIKKDVKNGKTIYPPGKLIFNAFNQTPFDQVKSVILGQDPYHGQGQANGLCFSVNKGIPFPPSLKNIFKELHADIGMPLPPPAGDLTAWATQGVLMLNAILTVIAHQPASYSKIGWERFTDAVIQKISEQKEGVVFLLWGRFARNKKALIDARKHFVLEAAHPSPFSANNGFFGCRHFSKTNQILKDRGLQPIQWDLSKKNQTDI